MTTYFDTHCYGCGEPFTAETLALRAEVEERGEEPGLVERLNASSAEHRSCFE